MIALRGILRQLEATLAVGLPRLRVAPEGSTRGNDVELHAGERDR
ncbi:MAG: hypothetical protein AB1726_15410 [Planctomycetota bacterium]